ncbi:MAG TPA: hypothetical protein VK558_10935, partial [Patescibacteria group bacterium]|nr:hypothetical protein [Patescibacteria group bacterium]
MTSQSSAASLPQTAADQGAGLLFLLPFLLALFGMIYGFGVSVSGVDQAGFMVDPSRMVVIGGAYGLGLILCLSGGFGTGGGAGLSLYWVSLVGVLASALWSVYPQRVLINFIHLGGASVVCVAAFHSLGRDSRRLFVPLAVMLQGVILATIVVTKLFPSIGIESVTGRWQGITTNPNHLGIVTVLASWATTAALFSVRSRLARLGLLAFYPPIGWALLGSGSMSSMLLNVICGGGMLFLMSLRNNPPLLRIGKILFLVVGGLAVLLGVFAIAPNLLDPDVLLGHLGRDATLTGRTSLWATADDLIVAKPLLGWSYDSLGSVTATIVFDFAQFHNGYLDLLVRGGALGLGLFALITGRLLWVLFRLARHDYLFHAAGLVLVGATLLSNISEASIYREANELWQVYVLVLITAELLHGKARK